MRNLGNLYNIRMRALVTQPLIPDRLIQLHSRHSLIFLTVLTNAKTTEHQIIFYNTINWKINFYILQIV
jgi:hypothetical protein